MFRCSRLAAALVLLLPVVVSAQVDAYGRDASDGRQLPPLQRAVPAPAAASSEPATFVLLPYSTHATVSNADAIALGDVTGDGRPDVVATTTWFFDGENDDHVFVFPQGEDGTLRPPGKLPYGQRNPTRTGLALGNFDGQGALDVAIGAFGVTQLHASAAPPWLTYAGFAAEAATTVTRIDLDGAGRDDFVVLSWWSGGTRFIANAAGGYDALPWDVFVSGYNSIATGDLDGDGIDDIVSASGQGKLPNVNVTRNNHDGTLTDLGYLDARCDVWFARGVGIGDFNGDGNNDIVASAGGNTPTSCLLLFLGSGNGQFAAPQTLPSYDIPEALAVADIDLDGRDDVLVLHGGWAALGVYRQRADGTLAPEQLFEIPYTSHYNPQGLVVGDFTGDGRPDVAFAGGGWGVVTLANATDAIFADRFD
ncbi:FG-GAP repeat domain-containing protein [Tahibacter sp. UC22_41]|uniref:FG-GAP repeat domain-containing protein n=1 Tax=Tahibacter sp. UC22_41 TaxID=3350178 RepID=UPI0036DA3592